MFVLAARSGQLHVFDLFSCLQIGHVSPGYLRESQFASHRAGRAGEFLPEYDIASLFMVSFYCFVIKACARRPGAAASVERRRRERRTLLAGAAGELARVTRLRQARPSRACTFSADHK